MPRLIIIQTSFNEEKEALDLARLLVSKKLAACCNLLPNANSIYKWNDKIEESKEFILEIKTRASLYTKVEKLIQKHHSYECPAIYAMNIAKISKKYAKWLIQCTNTSKKHSITS